MTISLRLKEDEALLFKDYARVNGMTVSLLLANLLLCATKRRLGESLTLDVRKLKKESQ